MNQGNRYEHTHAHHHISCGGVVVLAKIRSPFHALSRPLTYRFLFAHFRLAA